MGKAGKKKAKKSKPPRSPRLQLLEEDGEASRKFKQVLVALFGRFDTDGDRVLSPEELKAFSRAANEDEREFTEEELEEVENFFDWKGEGASGGLTLRGWMQMYVTQTQGREEDTWEDLYRLGYNGQLDIRPTQALKAEGELLEMLERLIALGEAGDLEAFVEAFVAPDVDEEDRAYFLGTLRGGKAAEGSEAKEGEECPAQLPNLLAELRCCATGEGVFKVEGSQESGPVTFHFHSPAFDLKDKIDREVVFLRQDGRWFAEG